MLNNKLVFAALALLAAPIAAQVQPLPANPLQQKPTLQQIAPLGFTEMPTGVVVLQVASGTGPQSAPLTPVRIRTEGGRGTVTMSIAVDGANAGRFSLVSPQALTSVAGHQIVAGAPQQPQIGGALTEASSVTRLLAVTGTGSIPTTMPADHEVTVTARDSGGSEVSRSFSVRFVRAAAKPAIATSASATKEVLVDRSAGLNSAQLAVVPTGEVEFVPYNEVTVRPASGSTINWHPLDPGSEVLCIYGSFRYACDLAASVASGSLPSSLTVKVPDIGRGKSIRIVLTGPYGESNAASASIDSQVTTTLRESVSTGQFGGKYQYRTAPVIRGTVLPKNGGAVKCGLSYLVWNELSVGDKVFFKPPPGAPPISIKLDGDAKVRVVSVPRNQRITDNPDTSWALMESEVPAGVTNFYVHDVTYSYSTQVGECAERRR